MKWWSRFLQERKQNDRVKLQCLFVLAGLSFLGLGIWQGVEFYQQFALEIEYICFGYDVAEKLDTQLQNVQELEDVIAASRQQEVGIEVYGSSDSLVLSCAEVSQEYLEQVYGCSTSSSMKVIYLNAVAYEQCQNLLASYQGSEKELRAEYAINDQERGMAVLKLLEGLEEDTAMGFVPGDQVDLRNQAKELRICFRQQDLSGIRLKELQSLGLTVENGDILEQNRLMLEMQLLNIRYQFILAILFLAFAWILQKYGK